jgi:L-cysteine/cystine lyase
VNPSVGDARIQSLRDEMSTLRHSSYFNYGARGPMADTALAAMFNAFEQQNRLGPYSVEANLWAEESMELARGEVARWFDALPEQICFGESVSALCNAVLWGLDWKRGDRMLVAGAENPTVFTAAQNIAGRLGIGIDRWDDARDADPTASLVRALTPATRLFLISHVLWTTGERMPLEALVRCCRERSGGRVRVLADGAQAFGSIPVGGAGAADYYVATAHKWACGPDGVAMLYALDPESLRPTFAGWRGVDSEGRPLAALRRLEVGTPPYALLEGLRTALELHDQAGSAADRNALATAQSAHLHRRLAGLAHARPGLTLLSDPNRTAGIAALQLSAGGHRELVYRLEMRNMLVREVHDPSAIRICTHYFTTTEEIDALADAIEELVA